MIGSFPHGCTKSECCHKCTFKKYIVNIKSEDRGIVRFFSLLQRASTFHKPILVWPEMMHAGFVDDWGVNGLPNVGNQIDAKSKSGLNSPLTIYISQVNGKNLMFVLCIINLYVHCTG